MALQLVRTGEPLATEEPVAGRKASPVCQRRWAFKDGRPCHTPCHSLGCGNCGGSGFFAAGAAAQRSSSWQLGQSQERPAHAAPVASTAPCACTPGGVWLHTAPLQLPTVAHCLGFRASWGKTCWGPGCRRWGLSRGWIKGARRCGRVRWATGVQWAEQGLQAVSLAAHHPGLPPANCPRMHVPPGVGALPGPGEMPAWMPALYQEP